MSDLTCLMLAAGIGSRYGGMKQLDAMGPHGETIMDYSLYDAHRAGFKRVVFVIRGETEEAFREYIRGRIDRHFDIAFAHQELSSMLPAGFEVPETRKKPWGTAHAVLCARDMIDGPFIALNADDFYGRSSYQALADALNNTPDSEIPEYCMVGFRLCDTLSKHGSVARGVCRVSKDGYLEDVREMTKISSEDGLAFNANEDGSRTEIPYDAPVSMNMWGFLPSFFTHAGELFHEFIIAHGHEEKSEFFIPSVVSRLLKTGQARMRVLSGSHTWFGVTYKEDKPTVVSSIRALISAGEYPEHLWQD